MKSIIQLQQLFSSIFNTTQQPRIFFSPGRINLIGEHTDYNGGHVFPAAINMGTYALAAKRSDNKLNMYSANFPDEGIIDCDLSNLAYHEHHRWANFPKGMFHYLMNAGYEIRTGADILFYGDIPNSAGLSSSASLELATGTVFEGLYNKKIDRLEMVKIGQKVENEYIGVNSGIMDQFAVGMGKKNHAILLNCDTMQYYYAPLPLDGYNFIIIHTNKARTLAGSKYNERRLQCEKALQDFQSNLNIDSLADLTTDTYEANKHLIRDPIYRKRAKHVVYENARTLQALEKLKQHDLKAFGQLMKESHISLRDDYEVTGKELDTIVEAAWEQSGVIGARMTGAGFGGCAIAIVKTSQKEQFQQQVQLIYQERTELDATFYTVTMHDGAKEITKGVKA
ncbi:galactokinase [Oceanobacillus kimchii]|uniref:Galactokinase n=1 Tax=Oceanobacillus kimchii TaxID=746691 RepID=A0ABQ5TJY0_9BACI|nr:galactokinase [Oceanobacillus kimchii]GLO64797.1 galactokinase [Oceanobacillus kimchii]